MNYYESRALVINSPSASAIIISLISRRHLIPSLAADDGLIHGTMQNAQLPNSQLASLRERQYKKTLNTADRTAWTDSSVENTTSNG